MFLSFKAKPHFCFLGKCLFEVNNRGIKKMCMDLNLMSALMTITSIYPLGYPIHPHFPVIFFLPNDLVMAFLNSSDVREGNM